MVDTLIIGAYIEARSCERFHKLAPYLDDELKKFYLSLLKSEGRHFKDYLTLAENISEEPITERVAFLQKWNGKRLNPLMKNSVFIAAFRPPPEGSKNRR